MRNRLGRGSEARKRHSRWSEPGRLPQQFRKEMRVVWLWEAAEVEKRHFEVEQVGCGHWEMEGLTRGFPGGPGLRLRASTAVAPGFNPWLEN